MLTSLESICNVCQKTCVSWSGKVKPEGISSTTLKTIWSNIHCIHLICEMSRQCTAHTLYMKGQFSSVTLSERLQRRMGEHETSRALIQSPLKCFQQPCCADGCQTGCNKGLASVFPCRKWHLLFLISDVIHPLHWEASPAHCRLPFSEFDSKSLTLWFHGCFLFSRHK